MAKRARFFWRLLVTFLLRQRKLVLFGFIIGIATFFLLPQVMARLPKRQETKLIGLVGRFTLENIPMDIQNQISIGLTQMNEDGTVSPGLAKEWIVEDEGKAYTFKLATNKRWHDQTLVKTADINYNFKDVEMEIIDPQTIKFKLKEPFSPFPVIVSRPLFKKGLVGVGEYKVQKITRNGEFAETIFLQSQDKEKPHLKYRFYSTEQAAKTGLKLGEVKMLTEIIDPAGFEDWPNIQVSITTKTDRYLALFFNLSDPNLQEKSFRQSLAYAIAKDKDKPRALGPIPPHSWAYNEDVKPYDFNLENAKKLFGNTVDKNKKITLRLATSPSLLQDAEKIKNAWAALGMVVEIEPFNTSLADFQVLLAIQQVPSDPDQYTLWHSSQAGNITHLKNPRIDQLLEEGRRTQDREKRKQIYADFQRFLAEEVPLIFLYYPSSYTIAKE